MPKPPPAAPALPLPAAQADDDDGRSAAQAADQARSERSLARSNQEAMSGLALLADALRQRLGALGPVPPLAAIATAATAPPATAARPGRAAPAGHPPRRAAETVETRLDALVPLLSAHPGSPGAALPAAEREAVRAGLNAMLGDRLAHAAHPLALEMAWRHAGRTLAPGRPAIAAGLPRASERVLLLLPGLGMIGPAWPGTPGPDGCDLRDHGAALAEALAFTPLHLQYNSGLHVSTNGRALAALLERLLHAWPRPIARFAILGHGLGGLLARSALHYGRVAGLHWPDRLDDLVCLGTPHHGAAPMGTHASPPMLPGASPYAAALARLVGLRSAGVTDLEHGNVVDEDWRGGDRLARNIDRRLGVPLPAGPRCHAIGAVAPPTAGESARGVPGDGLVSLASALGKHRLARRTLKFAPERQLIVDGIDHRQLLSSPRVFEQLRRWLAP